MFESTAQRLLLVLVVGVTVAGLGLCSIAQTAPQRKSTTGQSPKKKKGVVRYPLFLEGTECEININGDETRMVPGLGRAKVVTPDSIVLEIWHDENLQSTVSTSRFGVPEVSWRVDNRVYDKLYDAIRTGDSDGIDILVRDHDVARLKMGTKVRVTEAFNHHADTIPCDNRGGRKVRIVEGEYKGQEVIIPARNLRMFPEQPKAEQPKPSASPSSRARSLLRSAQNLEKMGKLAAAKSDYQQIIVDFPDSPEAKVASDRLKELGHE